MRNLPPLSITASSQRDGFEAHTSIILPQNDTLGSPGGWVSSETALSQWIQVAFPGLMNIENIATEGLNQIESWVKAYRLSHSTNGIDFKTISDENGFEIDFVGNKDSLTFSVNELSFNATHVRLLPQSWNNRIALRWELFGCPVGENFRSLPTTLS